MKRTALRMAWAALGAILCHVASPAAAAQATFYAAAGKADITPDPKREAVWLAGYGVSGRRAAGVQQPLYARALVLSDGQRTTALVAVDAIGVRHDDVLSWRRELGWLDGPRYLFVAATHSHSAPDTLGLWGRFPALSTADPAYRRRIGLAVTGLVRELSRKLQEAEVYAARADLDPKGLCTDDRDPFVVDPELEVLRVRGTGTKAGDGSRPIATLVRWSCHPATLTRQNRDISPDFPGPLCDRIEASGGGACVYLTGAIGGHLIPDTDRSAPVERQVADARRIGERVADAALRALATGQRVSGRVDFRTRTVRVPVDNPFFLSVLPELGSSRRLLDGSGAPLSAWKQRWLALRHLLFFPLAERARPWVETEAARVDIGPVRILGVPGEIFPELVLGGYDGGRSFGHPLVDPGNPNPPRVDRAPKGPYLRDKLRARHGFVVGLANDEIGYLVPAYDFQASSTRTMRPKPRGTHYDETMSLGVRAAGILLEAFDSILR